METQLYLSLTVLAYISGAMVLLVSIMLFISLFNLSKLIKNINETTDIVKEELVPTLKNVNKTVEILSGIVIKADESINKVKDFIQKSPLGIFSKLSSLTNVVAKGFWNGLCTAFKIFSSKK